MSNGNAEQQSAQHRSAQSPSTQHPSEAPKGPNSPNSVQTSPQARQGVQERSPLRGPEDQSNGKGSENWSGPDNRSGATQQPRPQQKTAPQSRAPQEPPAGQAGNGPTAKPQEDVLKSANGQGKESREEQVATPRTGAEAARPRPNPPAPAQSKPAPSPWTQQRLQHQTGGQPAAAAAQPEPRTAESPTSAPPRAQAPHSAAPGAVPVWDPLPPPQPRQSLLARLGIGKKAAQPEESDNDTSAPDAPQAPAEPPQAAPAPTGGATTRTNTAAPQAPAKASPKPEVQPRQPAPGPAAAATPGAAPATPGAAPATPGAAPATPGAAPATQARPQAPVAQPSMQPPVRREETTGRTPPVPGGARPGTAAPATGPQARMPGTPPRPGAPAPFPIPAPAQALNDSATTMSPAVGAPTSGPGSAATASEVPMLEAYHPAKPKVGVARRTRKARLRLSRLDPWSVMKTSFLFSIAAGIMLVVAVYSNWAVLSTSHLFDSINEIVRSVVSTPGDTTPFRIQEYINTQKVMGITALIACVDVVIFTALATLGSFLYNLAATMLGGLEITLAED